MSILSIYVCIYRISLALSFFFFPFSSFSAAGLLLSLFPSSCPRCGHAAAAAADVSRGSRVRSPECRGVSVHPCGRFSLHTYVHTCVRCWHARKARRALWGGWEGEQRELFYFYFHFYFHFIIFIFVLARKGHTRRREARADRPHVQTTIVSACGWVDQEHRRGRCRLLLRRLTTNRPAEMGRLQAHGAGAAARSKRGGSR